MADTNLFINYPKVNYRFGSNEQPVTFQDLSVYIDIFDQIRDYGSYYQNYQIQNNERPDHVSYELYGTTDHYWTFYFLNKELRQSGWPLDNFRVFRQAQEYYPHIVASTRGSVYIRALDQYISMSTSEVFSVGGYVWFNLPGNGTIDNRGLAKIIKVNHNLGQLFVEMDNKDKMPPHVRGNPIFGIFPSGLAVAKEYEEAIDSGRPISEYQDLHNSFQAELLISNYTEVDGPSTMIPSNGSTRPADPVVKEYDAIHEFRDVNGELVFPSYFQPSLKYEGPWALRWDDVNTVQSITYLERLQSLNEAQRSIQVIKPDAITQVISEFKSLLRAQLDR